MRRGTLTVVSVLTFSLLVAALVPFPAQSQPGLVRVPQDYSTIQQAIDASSPGVTILVSAGTYNENITVWKPLTVKGENKQATIIAKLGVFAVCEIAADNSTVSGFTIEGGSVGVWIHGSDYVTVIDNIIVNNDDGVWTTSSIAVTVAGNIMTDNLFMGLYLYSSNDTIVDYNKLTNNTYGAYLENSRDNSIHDNNVSLNYGDGFFIAGSSHNTLFHNMIFANTFGVYLEGSNSNAIYENHLLDNLEQAWADSAEANNWDNGVKGNYWSDYNGVDSNGDGVGDTPYVINQNNQDRYPLMQPWTNIAVSDAPSPRKSVAQGATVRLRLSIENQGWNDERTNVTVRVDTTLIASFANIDLASRNLTIITIIWNTSSFSKDNHTLIAHAIPVAGETYTGDNTFVTLIIVTIYGDVNGNRVVDIFDAIALAGAFSSVLMGTNWNANADVNCDDVVDIFDAIILAANFGKTG